jgi:hypothetical protein
MQSDAFFLEGESHCGLAWVGAWGLGTLLFPWKCPLPSWPCEPCLQRLVAAVEVYFLETRLSWEGL